MVKKSITDWNNQYTYTVDLDGNKEYAINLSQFKSAKATENINANDVVAVNFSFINSRNVTTAMSINLSQARFSNALAATANEDATTLKVTPNPSNGKFVTTFTSATAEDVLINVIELASGKVVKTMNHKATKGTNPVVVDLSKNNASGIYIVNITSNTQSFKPAKLVVSKN